MFSCPYQPGTSSCGPRVLLLPQSASCLPIPQSLVGILAALNQAFPGIWALGIDGTDAFTMVILAYVWSGIPFNFVILLAGLQSVPYTLHQAAAMDGAGPWRRIFEIQLPLIAPQLLLIMVLEFTESITAAFALVDTMTKGGPGGTTTLLVQNLHRRFCRLRSIRCCNANGASDAPRRPPHQRAVRLLGRRVNYER